MKFKIDPTFEKYWPPLPEEKFIILEKSILDEGLRDNLIVWKEKNILLDGHQRLRILKKNNISLEGRITYLSFPDEVHAKHWVHVTQAARRGDAPQFLSICHVLEFEPIYREEAKQRQRLSPGRGQKKVCTNGADLLETGTTRAFMARDSAASEHSIQRVLYIREHDPQRFERLKKLAERGEEYEKDAGPGRGKGSKEISIHLEWAKVKAGVDSKAAGVALDEETIEKFDSSNTVRSFSDAVRKYRPPISIQKEAAGAIIENQDMANKNRIEDHIIRRLPKRETKKETTRSHLATLKEKMREIADDMNKISIGISELQDLRGKFGDDLYFQAIAEMPEIRAAFVRFYSAAKSFQNGGTIEKKEN